MRFKIQELQLSLVQALFLFLVFGVFFSQDRLNFSTTPLSSNHRFTCSRSSLLQQFRWRQSLSRSLTESLSYCYPVKPWTPRSKVRVTSRFSASTRFTGCEPRSFSASTVSLAVIPWDDPSIGSKSPTSLSLQSVYSDRLIGSMHILHRDTIASLHRRIGTENPGLQKIRDKSLYAFDPKTSAELAPDVPGLQCGGQKLPESVWPTSKQSKEIKG